MQIPSDKILFALPSKGRMGDSTLEFMKNCGLEIQRKNRDYIGTISAFPNIQIIFQNQTDILKGVEGGSISLGIVGLDLVREYSNPNNQELIIIHEDLEFGQCSLELAIPEEWNANTVEELFSFTKDRKIRIATKFHNCTCSFLQNFFNQIEVIKGNGSLEVYPALDYADAIADLVSSGATLRANRLKKLKNGKILSSQAVFIGNRYDLRHSMILESTRKLLEIFEAYLRGKKFVQIFANIKESNPHKICKKLFSLPQLSGLQGPTISPIYTSSGQIWNAIHIVVPRILLQDIISSIRIIGGSGVVVAPVSYLFEEEPLCYRNLIKAIEIGGDV